MARYIYPLQDGGVEAEFHLAAINGTEYFCDASWMVPDVNVRTTWVELPAIEGSSVKYAIYASSSEVYGDPQVVPTPEEHPVLLHAFVDRDSYASSKAMGDVYSTWGARMVCTKYGRVVGERIRPALTEPEFTMIGDGSHRRSFCRVTDGTRIIADLFERGVNGFINVGNEEEVFILDFAVRIHARLDRHFEPIFLPERPHDHRRRCPDLARLRRELPVLQLTPLDAGLDLTIEHFRRELDTASG